MNHLIHWLFVVLLLCLSNHANAADRVFSIGVIDEFYSQKLAEHRTLNIYLPDDYNPNDPVRYPVIYLLDGSAQEDFVHVVGIVQYQTLPWIARMPKSIVVGIANVDRKRDFTSPTRFPQDKQRYPTSGGSASFIAFIEQELIPYVNKKYKTTAHKTLIGQSLGGLVATEILFSKPSLFQHYVIISPSLWWNDGDLLQANPILLQDSFQQPTSIYIGVGKEGLTPGLDHHVMEVDANRLADKIKQTKSKSVRVYFDYLPQEDHATVTHPAVFQALRWLYPATTQR